MAHSLSIPTTSALLSSQVLPSSHPLVVKTLNRLTRPSLLLLARDWLDERNQALCAPYLRGTEDEDGDGDGDEAEQADEYPPAASLPALREEYTEVQTRKGTKRDVLDRMLEGDWRRGITLYQLAMADMQYLYDHPASQKWSALKIVRMHAEVDGDTSTPAVPRFHPSTFIRNLQNEVLPDVKAHWNLDRHATLPILVLRVMVVESPWNTERALTSSRSGRDMESTKVFYLAFPDFAPFVYISLNAASGSGTTRGNSGSLRRLILEGIPKAFSKPRERYSLESTDLMARSLEALVDRRGGARTNAAGGGWEAYASTTLEQKERDNPLNTQLATPPAEDDEDADELANDHLNEIRNPGSRDSAMKRKRDNDQPAEGATKRKRLMVLAKSRFGESGKFEDGKGIERFDVRIDDPFTPTSLELDDLSSSMPTEESALKDRRERRSEVDMQLDKDSTANENEPAAEEGWKPDIRLTFHGSHVFAGVRELVEAGIVDGRLMPGWMTGEDGVSVGIVREGRIKGFKGSTI